MTSASNSFSNLWFQYFYNFRYDPEIIVNPGDEFKTTCVYNTMSKENLTYWADDTFSEMCFGIFTYFPKSDIVG